VSAFDLYPQETAERLGSLRPVSGPEPGVFDNFLRGVGMSTMRTAAGLGGRLATMGAAGIARGFEKLGELHPLGKVDTTFSDAIFRFHDDVVQNAVDYWTPKPGEVGVAGDIVGQLLGTLPFVAAAPAATIGGTILSTGTDLVRKGVDPLKAAAVGTVQGAGLATGIWMPVLGNNLWQRMLIGGAGFNVVQGVGTRAASGLILEGTAAAEDFKAFDPTALTLDVLMGLAFGGLVHLSPAQRAQGARMWERIEGWAQGLKPSDKAAILALRQAEHRNVETTPGRLTDIADVAAHGERMRTAIEQTIEGRPVQVEDLPAPRFEPDAVREAEAVRVMETMRAEAEALGKAHDIVLAEPMSQPKVEPDSPGVAPKASPTGDTGPGSFSSDAPGGQAKGMVDPGAAGVEPLQAEAMRFAAQHGDTVLTVGRNPDGSPMTTTVRDFLAEADARLAQAQDDTRLFQVAAACMLGVH